MRTHGGNLTLKPRHSPQRPIQAIWLTEMFTLHELADLTSITSQNQLTQLFIDFFFLSSPALTDLFVQQSIDAEVVDARSRSMIKEIRGGYEPGRGSLGYPQDEALATNLVLKR